MTGRAGAPRHILRKLLGRGLLHGWAEAGVGGGISCGYVGSEERSKEGC